MDNEQLDKELNKQVTGNASEYDYNPEYAKKQMDKLFGRFKKNKKPSKHNGDKPSAEDNEAWMDRTVEAGKVPVGTIYTETDYSIKSDNPLDYISETISTIVLAPFRLTKELSVKCVFLGKEELLKTIKLALIPAVGYIVYNLGYSFYKAEPINYFNGYQSLLAGGLSVIILGGFYFFIKQSNENVLTYDMDLADNTRRSKLSEELKESVVPDIDTNIDEVTIMSYEEFKQSAEAKLSSGELSSDEIKRTFQESPNDLFAGTEELYTSNKMQTSPTDTVNAFLGEDDLFSDSEPFEFEDDDLFSSFGGDF